MLDMNMIRVPSGDHAGELFVPRNLGHAIPFPLSIEYMQICALRYIPAGG
jgi:hypothetical protein